MSTANVILEARTRNGKRVIEADGDEWKLFKKISVDKKGQILIGIESMKTDRSLLIYIEKDKDFTVRFQ